MDGAFPGSIDISTKKARTVALTNGIPSAGLYESAQPGQALYGIQETNGGLVVFGGGLPVYFDGGDEASGKGTAGGGGVCLCGCGQGCGEEGGENG